MGTHTHARPRTAGAARPRVLISLEEVIARTAMSKTLLYKKIREGTFPRPVAVGARRRAWVEAEVADWIDARVAERDATR